MTFRSATYHNEKGLRRLAALPRHALHGKEKDLGLCPHLQGELFPLTPSIELPTPSILEGLPRRLASPKRIVLRNCREGEESVARVNSLMLLSWISTNRWPIPVRLPLTLTVYFSSPLTRLQFCNILLQNSLHSKSNFSCSSNIICTGYRYSSHVMSFYIYVKLS